MTTLRETRKLSTKKKRKSAPVGVITKVLRILELLHQYSEGLQLKDVADKTGINKSTALRFLTHLEQENYLLRDRHGAYSLGLRLMRLGGDKSFEKFLCTTSRPILENLRTITSENVNLAVLDGMNVLHLDGLDSPHRLSVISEIGQTGELYCTALGKAIVAYMEDGPRRDELFASIQFVAKTPRTITSMARFKRELAQIKKQGFAHDDEEDSIGARCIGAPIFGPDGIVIAALSVSGPITRIPKQRLLYYAKLVCQAAQEISESLNLSSVGHGSGAKVNGSSGPAHQLTPARASQLASNHQSPIRGGARSPS